MNTSYCVKCKKQTFNVNEKYEKAKNGRSMLKSSCSICGSCKSKFVKTKHGGRLDIHKQILKVAPKSGFVLPGHHYTGPGNPLSEQVLWDSDGNIINIYQKPTGKTDAVSMQHDVDYSVCSQKPNDKQVKCKNNADIKMVKALDSIPYNERQWGHALARNTIATKAKLGMGVSSKNGKSRRVKKSGKKN